ncbi:GNAT family N-acetyltransferase [Paenibacillus sp. GCM10028914]|uniref:GNAT family N-acetyltransferase n=1 Tax=Paenibacillus sp. GCM10028914 TaxID=3273416 RepID=UPI00361E7253
MIIFRDMEKNDAAKIGEIDRSERIEFTYRMNDKGLEVVNNPHDCPNWQVQDVEWIKDRTIYEIVNGGRAIGAFDEHRLVGFGVSAHKLRGRNNDQLQIVLMYVSNQYRRRGIGTAIMNMLSNEAAQRGAKYLYISSTETESAYNFYKSCGSEITDEVDEELFDLEPNDIHMLKKL